MEEPQAEQPPCPEDSLSQIPKLGELFPFMGLLRAQLLGSSAHPSSLSILISVLNTQEIFTHPYTRAPEPWAFCVSTRCSPFHISEIRRVEATLTNLGSTCPSAGHHGADNHGRPGTSAKGWAPGGTLTPGISFCRSVASG